MPRSLPARANLEWLKKTAKQRLKALVGQGRAPRLADAQLAVARDYGFTSWRALKQHVDRLRLAPGSPELEPAFDDRTVQSFLRLVGSGQMDEVQRTLAASPGMVNAAGPHPFWGGRAQALHVAIETRRRDMFDTLLEAGADVSGTNDQYDQWSPLMVAVNRNRPDMRDELLRRGARVGLPEALLLSDDKTVERLLKGGRAALPDSAPNGGSFLNFARTRFAIDRLLELGVSARAKDRWGATPIDSMSRLGRQGRALVRHMIARGIRATPEVLARLGERGTLQSLAERNGRIVRSAAVMMGAVDFRHHGLVQWLLAQGASPNARTNASSRHTALHAAAWNGDLRMVKLLVDAGADVSTRDDQHHGTARDWAEVATRIENNPACRTVVEYLAGLEPESFTGRGRRRR